jgi:putative oxidoreductase
MTRRFDLAAVLLARVGLAAGYLSAVADRFGAWGRPGTPGVVSGDFQRFITQVEAVTLTPPGTAPILAWLVTVLESSLGLSLLIGLRTRTMGLGSACLLLAFAVAMIFSPAGIHAVFTSSVLSAAGASMLLAARAADA